MMDRKKKFYSDILSSIELIEKFIENINSFESYISDLKTKSAVERQLIIIGEAVNSINKIAPDDLISSQQIISFRNRIVHAYDSIDDTIVWAIIKKHLNPLKEEIEKRL